MTSQILAKYSNERGWVRLTATDTVYSNQEKSFKKREKPLWGFFMMTSPVFNFALSRNAAGT